MTNSNGSSKNIQQINAQRKNEKEKSLSSSSIKRYCSQVNPETKPKTSEKKNI